MASRAPATKAQRKPSQTEEIGGLIARTRRALWAAISQRFDATGESIHAWRLLALLAREGPKAQCDLAMALGQHPAWVSRLVDELETQGVVRRHRDAADRRKLRVEATRSGRARYEANRPQANAAVEQVLEPLEEGERHELRRLLEKLTR